MSEDKPDNSAPKDKKWASPEEENAFYAKLTHETVRFVYNKMKDEGLSDDEIVKAGLMAILGDAFVSTIGLRAFIQGKMYASGDIGRTVSFYDEAVVVAKNMLDQYPIKKAIINYKKMEADGTPIVVLGGTKKVNKTFSLRDDDVPQEILEKAANSQMTDWLEKGPPKC